MSRLPVPVAGLAAGTALAIGFAVVAFSLPIDDFWLTLASGREIAAGADVARAIPLSWTPSVDGALNPQWGAQVLLGLPGWLPWALLLNAALIATGLLLTLERARRRAAPAAVAIAMLLGIAVLAPHLLARAQSFSIALFPAALLLLERGRGRLWLPLAYGALMAVWANLHGAFVIGQLAAAAAFAGALLERRPGMLLLALTFLVALVAPMLNPVGPALIVYAVNQPASDLIRLISVEWQPARPWIPVATPFWLLLVLVLAGRIARRGGARIGELLLLGVLAPLAIGGIRHIPWFVLAAVPLVADDVGAALAARPRLARAVGTLPGAFTGRRGAWLIGALAAAAVVVQLARPALPQGIGRLYPDEPVALVDRLAAELAPGSRTPVLNEQTWGGYLAYRLGARVSTAMDGRIEIRSRATWQAHFDLMHGDADPAAALADAGVDWALVGLDRTELVTALLSAGWLEVARDDQGVLLRDPDGAG